MRYLLIIAGLALGLVYFAQHEPAPSPSEVAETEAAQAERTQRREAVAERRRAEAKLAEDRAKAAAPVIDAALAEMAAKGVTRDDVKAHFYEEIEEEVCDQRKCEDD
ncbi:hypothetical protein ACFZ8E_24345 [Methylobacterium sp. HMF5984]|uniref:hypothetical protein n=1 Tax=Methylobacterium sp. HMF5984 TaxID=3367370 RepID=UPI003851AED4